MNDSNDEDNNDKEIDDDLFDSFFNNKTPYERNREWADYFIPITIDLIYYIMGDICHIEESSNTCDSKYSFDLLLINDKNEIKRMGVRFRDYSYYKKYNDEMTFRTTEIKKFKKNIFPDYYFYGFINKDEDSIFSFVIILEMNNIIKNWENINKSKTIPNIDDTSFKAIKIKELKKYSEIIES